MGPGHRRANCDRDHDGGTSKELVPCPVLTGFVASVDTGERAEVGVDGEVETADPQQQQ